MDLTKKERLSFIHQLRILEALYPDDADYYAKHRKALEEGYKLHYEWLFEHIGEEMSEEECREVLDVLDMYRAITFSLKKLPEGDELRNHHLATFTGFDGNNEAPQMGYARYFIVDLDRYDELKKSDYPYFNSHAPMLPIYRKMLERWQDTDKKHELARDDLTKILGTE